MKWGSHDEITQALRNICVPLREYHEMRPHYAAEIQHGTTKSIPSRARHKKPLNVLIRSRSNSGCSHYYCSGDKGSVEYQWLSFLEMTRLISWAIRVREWLFSDSHPLKCLFNRGAAKKKKSPEKRVLTLFSFTVWRPQCSRQFKFIAETLWSHSVHPSQETGKYT